MDESRGIQECCFAEVIASYFLKEFIPRLQMVSIVWYIAYNHSLDFWWYCMKSQQEGLLLKKGIQVSLVGIEKLKWVKLKLLLK